MGNRALLTVRLEGVPSCGIREQLPISSIRTCDSPWNANHPILRLGLRLIMTDQQDACKPQSQQFRPAGRQIDKMVTSYIRTAQKNVCQWSWIGYNCVVSVPRG